MRFLEFEFGYEFTCAIHIENTRSDKKYFSDGFQNEFHNFQSAKHYLKNQIEYAFSNLKGEYSHIINSLDDESLDTETDDLKIDKNLKLRFFEFIDSIKISDLDFTYNDLARKVFPKHRELFFNLYNYSVPDHFHEQEYKLAEMFDLYKKEQLQTAVNEEMFDYDLLSNKEKAICLSAFMEMYASERRSNIDLNRDKFSDLSFLLSDYIGEERADTIQTEINNKHKTEELILDQWIY